VIALASEADALIRADLQARIVAISFAAAPWEKREFTDRFGSLSRLDEAPKATFSPVLLRQRCAIGLMRIDRACRISMRRERIEFFQIPSRMAIRGRTRPIEDIVKKGAI
jgi:hypothetical protein